MGIISSFVTNVTVGMKHHKVVIIIFFLFLSVGANAQINHFIYLQTENKQPFYVKLDKILMSSSAAGYLIIPKLTDGNYTITVGFPKNEWKEQAFTCTVQQVDAGYLLKNFGEKGWGLFNLQSLDITMSQSDKEAVTAKKEDKADAFSALLSTVVNEPALAKKDIVKAAIVKTDTISSGGNTSNTPTEAIAEQAVENTPASTIKKVVETTTGGELHLVYIDNTNNKKDSIDIFIPTNDQPVAKQVASPTDNIAIKDAVVIAINTTPSTNDKEAKNTIEQQNTTQQVTGKQEKVAEPVKEDLPNTDNKEGEQPTKKSTKTKPEKPAKLKTQKFLPMELAVVTTTTDTLTTTATTPTNPIAPVSTADTPAIKQTTGIINSDCISNATDEDFLKLRKKMAAATTDENMVEIAKKVLKQKCFSTGQIKNLAVLFLNDKDRYSFFDLAYPFVWDSYNYSSLENQLTDPYFNNRFKAMIRK